MKFRNTIGLAALGLLLSISICRSRASTLESADIGNPKIKGSTSEVAGGLDIIAGGKDVWGVTDEFRYAYQKRTGDFDVVVRIERLSPAQLYSRAGIMARESLAADSRHVFFIVFADNKPRHNNNAGYEFQFRDITGGHSKAIYPAASGSEVSPFLVSYPKTWLRLQRRGNDFTAFASSDGLHWSKYGTQSNDLPESLYLGLALTAHDVGGTASASFRDFADFR
jgi:hypothetical protein